MSMRVHSRWGSIVLGLIGAAYAIGASSMLVWAVATTWSFAGLLDYALLLTLAGAAAIGVWFVVVSTSSLGLRLEARFRRHRTSLSSS